MKGLLELPTGLTPFSEAQSEVWVKYYDVALDKMYTLKVTREHLQSLRDQGFTLEEVAGP